MLQLKVVVINLRALMEKLSVKDFDMKNKSITKNKKIDVTVFNTNIYISYQTGVIGFEPMTPRV